MMPQAGGCSNVASYSTSMQASKQASAQCRRFHNIPDEEKSLWKLPKNNLSKPHSPFLSSFSTKKIQSLVNNYQIVSWKLNVFNFPIPILKNCFSFHLNCKSWNNICLAIMLEKVFLENEKLLICPSKLHIWTLWISASKNIFSDEKFRSSNILYMICCSFF